MVSIQLMNSSNKLRLWVLSHGRVPSSHMAHKVYRWVDSEGRPTTPPLDPFEIMEQKSRGGSNRLLSEADERKVCCWYCKLLNWSALHYYMPVAEDGRLHLSK